MKFFKSIIIALIFFILGTTGVNALENDNNKSYKILIDPGHGGYDGGAKSKSGILEKDINLQVSLKLRDALKNKGYTVYMTREDDIALANRKRDDLELRCKMKKETGCDLFISVHQNSFPQSNTKGLQVWHASDENSKMLAETVQNTVKEILQPKNHRVAKDAKKDYKILRDGCKCGNIIIECGFLSNNEDEENLKTDSYQSKLADAITIAIEKYLNEKPKGPVLN